jgi:hypothetical protein
MARAPFQLALLLAALTLVATALPHGCKTNATCAALAPSPSPCITSACEPHLEQCLWLADHAQCAHLDSECGEGYCSLPEAGCAVRLRSGKGGQSCDAGDAGITAATCDCLADCTGTRALRAHLGHPSTFRVLLSDAACDPGYRLFDGIDVQATELTTQELPFVPQGFAGLPVVNKADGALVFPAGLAAGPPAALPANLTTGCSGPAPPVHACVWLNRSMLGASLCAGPSCQTLRLTATGPVADTNCAQGHVCNSICVEACPPAQSTPPFCPSAEAAADAQSPPAAVLAPVAVDLEDPGNNHESVYLVLMIVAVALLALTLVMGVVAFVTGAILLAETGGQAAAPVMGGPIRFNGVRYVSVFEQERRL